MNYGNYKIISILTPSLNNKFGGTSNSIRYQLQDGDAYANINDSNASVVVKNVTGYLFDIPTIVSAGSFSIDFSDNGLANLPAGKYEFQLNAHVENNIAKYPDIDFVPFVITTDARVSPNGLVPQITLDQILNNVDEKVKQYTDTISKGDKGDIGDKGDTGVAGSNGQDGKNARVAFNNVLDFGADRSGLTDSTAAILSALKYADQNSETSAYLPRGTYLVSDKILLSGNKLIGQSKGSTTLKLSQNAGINLWDKATLSDVTIDITTANDGIAAIELGTNYTNANGVYQYTGGRFNTISHIIINDSPKHLETIGIYAKPELLADLAANTGVWGNVVEDINMNNIGTGIKLDALNRGWINGNSFRDILIRGFQKFGVALDSSNIGGMDVQVNTFDSIQVQGVITTPINAIAFDIKAGNWNFFNHLSHWNDYSHIATTRDDVIALNFGTSVQHNRYYKVANNSFVNSKFEGTVSGNTHEIAMNNIDVYWVNNEKRASLNGGSMFLNYFSNKNKTNILPMNIISNYSDTPEFSTIAISDDMNNGKPTSGSDANGNFVNIITGNSNVAVMRHRIFGKPYQRLSESKFLSYSIKFNTSANVTIVPMLIQADGASVTIDVDTTFTETLENGDMVLTMLVDLSQISLTGVKYVEMITTINGAASNQFVLRDIKASNVVVNNYNKYNIEHIGSNVHQVLTTMPNSWESLGIYLPNKTAFDSNLLDVKGSTGKYYITLPIEE